MCFSSQAAAPINRPSYTLDNSQSAVKQTVTDAPATQTNATSASTTSSTPSTSASGLKLPGMTM